MKVITTKNGSKICINEPNDKIEYRGLEFDHCYIDVPPERETLWQRIKLWFIMRRLKKNGAWITWTYK